MLMLHVDDEASVGDFRLGKQTYNAFLLGYTTADVPKQ